MTQPQLNAPQPALWQRLLPMLVVGMGAAGVLFLRGPMPLDEVRYTEVLRELLIGGKWLLTLDGEPYSHKTPLLFWLGWLAYSVGVPLKAALMVWSVLFSVASVGVVGRLGRKLGVPHADWILAAMLMPVVYSEVILFDSMLSFFVWLYLLMLVERRLGWAALAAVPMLLAKGPAALVFALPFGWALCRGQATGRQALKHTLLTCLPGLLALGAWAYLAIVRDPGGAAETEAFATELIWTQTAGRVTSSFAHARPIYWYVPILLIGTVPFTFQWGRLVGLYRKASKSPAALRWLAWALLACLVIWSLISGKQPHYMLPALPACAILFSHTLDQHPAGLKRVRQLGSVVLASLILVVLLARIGWPTDALAAYGERAEDLRSSLAWSVLVCGGALAAAIAINAMLWNGAKLRAVAASFTLGLYAVLAPVHAAVGALSMPEHLADPQLVARLAGHPVAIVKVKHAGIYSLLLERTDLVFLQGDSRAELRQWCEAHPDGFLLIDFKYSDQLNGLPVAVIARDSIRSKPMRLFGVTPGVSYSGETTEDRTAMGLWLAPVLGP